MSKTSEKDILNLISKKDKMDTRDLSRLLDFYRQRVENFEKERNQYLDRIEGLKIRQEDYHKLEWELRKREEEIRELQNLLSLSNNALNKERHISVTYKNEVESTKVKSMDDRRRLLQLLQLSEPLETTVKSYYERKNKGEIKCNVNVDPNVISLSKNLGTSAFSHNSFHKKTQQKQELVKSILPDEEKAILRQEIEICQDNAKNLKIYYESHLKKIEEDRKLREEEWRLQIINFNDKIEELTRKNQKIETLNVELTKDILQMKFDYQNNEKKMYEEIEMYKLQNEALSESLNQLNVKITFDNERNKNNFEKKTNDIANVYRTQVKNHEEKINIIQEQYKQVQKIYASRIEDYEQKLKKSEDKYKQLDFKRNSEIEGFINENNLIRKRMKTYEHYVFKLKQMTAGGLDPKKMSEVQNELANTQDQFTEGSKHFKKSLGSLKNKLVDAYRNKDVPEHDEPDNEQRSMDDDVEHDYEGNEMQMI